MMVFYGRSIFMSRAVEYLLSFRCVAPFNCHNYTEQRGVSML